MDFHETPAIQNQEGLLYIGLDGFVKIHGIFRSRDIFLVFTNVSVFDAATRVCQHVLRPRHMAGTC